MVPQLIPDMSSESEESDGFSSMPTGLSTNHATTNNAKQYSPYSNLPNLNVGMVDSYSSNAPYAPAGDDINTYLPHPLPSPTSPVSPSGYHYPDSPHNAQKSRRKKDGRRHDSSRDPDRIPISGAVDVPALAYGIDSLSIHPPSPISYSSSGSPTSPSSSPRKKGVRRHHGAIRPPASSSVGGGFGMHDDGCLGGF